MTKFQFRLKQFAGVVFLLCLALAIFHRPLLWLCLGFWSTDPDYASARWCLWGLVPWAYLTGFTLDTGPALVDTPPSVLGPWWVACVVLAGLIQVPIVGGLYHGLQWLLLFFGLRGQK